MYQLPVLSSVAVGGFGGVCGERAAPLPAQKEFVVSGGHLQIRLLGALPPVPPFWRWCWCGAGSAHGCFDGGGVGGPVEVGVAGDELPQGDVAGPGDGAGGVHLVVAAGGGVLD